MNGFQKIENKKYFSLLEKAPFKTFFHTREWENFLEKEFSWLRFEHYLWRDAALLSIARCTLLGKEKLVSHPFCEYGGPLPLKEGVNFEGFSNDFLAEFDSGARIKFHPYSLGFASVPRIISRQFRDEGLQTFILEDFSQKNKEDLLQGFRKTLRQEIKKSERCGIEISECKSDRELKRFYHLYQATVKRHKNIPLPISVFRFFNACTEARIYLARKDGRVIGGSIFLLYNPFIHYFINASDGAFRNCNVGHAIVWNVLQRYMGHRKSHIQYNCFDFGGTRKGSPLEVFKRGWGAKEFPIYEIGGTKGERSGSWKRKALGHIPTFAMRHIARYALYFKI